ncbi:hypothetical protein [Actinokineospora sp.]|uniref:hypothetical protein n=1 Tax=Actinokineospora sp. TaxID=1872133 RepID=UPI004037FFBA
MVPDLASAQRGPAARHRKRGKFDPVLLGLRVGSLLAGLGIVGVVSLLADGDRAPQVLPSNNPASSAPTSTTSVAPTRTIATTVATATISAAAPVPPPVKPPPAQPDPPVVTTKPPAAPPDPGFGVVVAGQPCPTAGAYAIGAGFQPMVCRTGAPANRLSWQSIF